MEIRSLGSSGELCSTLTQVQEKGQNMDAFSELFAMLFGKMLIPNSNGLNLMMNQDSYNNLNSTTSGNYNLEDLLSMTDVLRICSSQSMDTKNIQGFTSNNVDFQKLLNLSNDIPEELQEFINNFTGSSSKESEVPSGNLGSDTVNIISEQLNNINTSEVNNMNNLLNIVSEENAAVSEMKLQSNALNMQAVENASVSESNKSLDLLNIQATVTESNETSVESVNEFKYTQGTGYGEKSDNDGINNSANTEGEAESILPEKKQNSIFQLTNTSESTNVLNNIKAENNNKVDLQQNISQSSLVENPRDIIDIAVEKFKTLRLPGSTEVTVKLRPEELGEVSLKLVLEKGQINGSITADRKEVVVMLQNNLDQLKADLKSSNVNLNNLSVNIQAGEDFDRNNSRRGFSSKQNKNNHRMIQATEEEMQSYDLQEGFNIIA